MKNLKINVPKGYEIDKDKSTFDNIVFKEINKLPSSWDELEGVEGYRAEYLSGYFSRKSIFKTALAQLSQLRDVYRQGWQPDWCNSRRSYYCIVFDGVKLLTIACHYQNHFLSFQDRATAELFIANFRDLIEKAKPLMS
jgi:hypothetical protein